MVHALCLALRYAIADANLRYAVTTARTSFSAINICFIILLDADLKCFVAYHSAGRASSAACHHVL